MVVHLFLNNNKALDFLPINSIKNGGITIIFNLNGCMDTAIRFWNNTGGYADRWSQEEKDAYSDCKRRVPIVESNSSDKGTNWISNCLKEKRFLNK